MYVPLSVSGPETCDTIIIVGLFLRKTQKRKERHFMIAVLNERSRKCLRDCPLAPAQSSENGRCCRRDNKQAGRCSGDGALYPTREGRKWKHGQGYNVVSNIYNQIIWGIIISCGGFAGQGDSTAAFVASDFG